MSGFLWWIGAAHMVVYVSAGAFIAVTLVTVKVHMCFKVMGRIIQWHIARQRWNNRHTDGLSDKEWERGEPRP